MSNFSAPGRRTDSLMAVDRKKWSLKWGGIKCIAPIVKQMIFHKLYGII